MNVIDKIEKEQCKATVTEFAVGDTVTVATKIVEGSNERIQKFSGVQTAPAIGALKSRRHRTNTGQSGSSLHYQHFKCGRSLIQPAAYLPWIVRRPQKSTPLSALVSDRFAGQPFQYLGQFQCMDRFFK